MKYNEQFSQYIIRTIYNILGSSTSTKIAESRIGNFISKRLNHNDDGRLKIYEGIHHLKLKLTTQEANMLGFYYLGMINPFETRTIEHVLQPGDIFIDVGAYVDGWHSLVAAKKVGRKGHVYTFEPVFGQRLKENIKINKFTNITVSNIAISDKTGTSYFYIEDERSSLVQKHIKNSLQKKISVQTMSLDTYILKKRIKKIRLIKIDVEGAEMQVLYGAKKTLTSQNAPDLIMEVLDEHLKEGKSNQKKLFAYLISLGYKVAIFSAQGLKPIDNTITKHDGNNLYFTRRKIPSI